MIVRFNPTGTHIHKGFLKVRVDLYPDVGDKTYPIHHIQVPVIPPEGYQGKVNEVGIPVDQNDYDNWINGLPKIWQLNPALCAFIKVPETIIKSELEEFTRQLFSKDTVKTLDDILIKSNSIHLVSPFMRGKLTLSDQKVQTKDIADLIGSANGRFADLVLPLEGGGSSLSIKPQTIDIGPGAAGRTGSWNCVTYTTLNSGNPANATGTIDTWELWFRSNATGVKIGTFYGSGTSYTSRDYEIIGDVAGGSMQPFSGLTNDVEIGDFVGVKSTSGNIESESDSFTSYYDAGDQFGTGVQTYLVFANHVISLYGTGTEAGGVTHLGAATLSGVGTLTGIGRGIFIGQATLSGTGLLNAIGSFLRYGAITLSGAGTLVANGVITAIGQATLSGVGTLATIGTVIAGGVIHYGSVVLSGVGTLTASGFIIGVIRVTLKLYNRALTATLHNRALTAKLYNRSLTAKLYGRTLIAKLHNRAITLKKRVE